MWEITYFTHHRFLFYLFQIAHCFHQGPNTAKMNEKMTSCMTLKRMVQLVLQVTLRLILNIFRCRGISSTYLGESVSQSATDTFSFLLCWCLWTLTERLSTWLKKYLTTYLPTTYLPTYLSFIENTLWSCDPRNLSASRHLIGVMRRHGLAKKTPLRSNPRNLCPLIRVTTIPDRPTFLPTNQLKFLSS